MNTTAELRKEEMIILSIPKEKFNFLLKTIKSFMDSIYSWHLDRFISKKLITDLRIMRSILETNKTEVKSCSQP